MNDAVEKISIDSGLESIWWLRLDADEFPEGPEDLTISEYLKTLPSEYRVVGSNQINHFPVEKPYYIERYHPIDFMSYGEESNAKSFVINHCREWHWKHPLHKYVKDKPMIRAKSGFHMGYCSDILIEPKILINTHHFPFREKDKTYKRYRAMCQNAEKGKPRNEYNDHMSVNNESVISKRFKNLDYIYNQQWEKVYISPAPMTKKSIIGVKPKKYESNCPKWYEKVEQKLCGKGE